MAAEKPRVLVVDDDDPIRLMLAKIVERLDMSVDTARDGEEAIRQLERDGYSAIVLDLMMPKVDGFAVLRHMEQHHRHQLACTIIASAVPQPEIVRRFNVPVYRIHAKPFDVSKLMADIKECVETAARA
jgi:CheY-like chemotaxis protein